jgi:hypothetical protein
MDYRLKNLYEQMLSGKQPVSTPTKQQPSKSLTSLYETGVLATPTQTILEAKKTNVFYYYEADASVVKDIKSIENPINVTPVAEADIASVFAEAGLTPKEAKPMFGKDQEANNRRFSRVVRTAQFVVESGSGSTEKFYFKSKEQDPKRITLRDIIKNIGLAAGRQINQGHAGEAILGSALMSKFLADAGQKVEYFDSNGTKGIVSVLIEILRDKSNERPCERKKKINS